MSWISLPDEVQAIMHILDTPSLSGPVNLTSPEPITNGAYTVALGIALRRLAVIPTPAPLLKLALGEVITDELLLTSQKVIPKKLMESGFKFRFPFLMDAFNNTLHDKPDEEETQPTEEA
jgi:NAD dependent epimerase/dehydratase family enzyme